MKGKRKLRSLFISASILILLILIYSVKSSDGTLSDDAEQSKSFSISEAYSKAEEFANNTYDKLLYKYEEYKKEKEAKKKSMEVLMNPESTGNTSKGQKEEENTDGATNVESASSMEEKQETVEIDYREPIEILIPEGLKIPEKVGGTEFRKTNDYVYAKEETYLYESTDFNSDALLISEKWQQFLRVGISSGCCYELVDENGNLYFADGTKFLRHREDMPVTEDVNLPKEKVKLGVEYISQFPTLTNGSEITALTMILAHLGMDVSKDELANDYLPKGKVGVANFYDSFVGDPAKRNSYGCFAGAIVTAANNFLLEKESEYQAFDMTGISFTDVLTTVKEGTPVLVWSLADFSLEPAMTEIWIVDGEFLQWKTNGHAYVVYGYDSLSETVYVCDPTKGFLEIGFKDFIRGYKQFYSQAVIVKTTDSLN